MTRVTSFGRKRTSLQAGFSADDDTPSSADAAVTAPQAASTTTVESAPTTQDESAPSEAASNPPPKKKRKRTPKSKRDGHAAQKAAEAARLNGEESPSSETPQTKDGAADGTAETSSESTLTRLEKKQKRNLARRLKGKSCS